MGNTRSIVKALIINIRATSRVHRDPVYAQIFIIVAYFAVIILVKNPVIIFNNNRVLMAGFIKGMP